MGIINATPDSFSDGGMLRTIDAVVVRAETMVAEGADILDVGGESTRPNARSVDADEELGRRAFAASTSSPHTVPASTSSATLLPSPSRAARTCASSSATVPSPNGPQPNLAARKPPSRTRRAFSKVSCGVSPNNCDA